MEVRVTAEVDSLADDGAAEWMGVGLAAKGRWSLMPAGIDLYSGRTGIALFLAYLGAPEDVPEVERFAAEAKSDELKRKAALTAEAIKRRASPNR